MYLSSTKATARIYRLDTFTSIDWFLADKAEWNGSWWVNRLKLQQMTLQYVSTYCT